MQFKQFLLEAAELPDLMPVIKKFFDSRMDLAVLQVYGDSLEERSLAKPAEFFHSLAKWQDLKRAKGQWRAPGLFYDVFGYNSFDVRFDLTKMGNSWLFHVSKPSPGSHYAQGGYWEYHQMRRHIVFPMETSYRLSLTNGKWSRYTNTGDDRVSVVSIRHQATPESEEYYPVRRISLNDYKPMDVQEVPDNVLYFAFYRILEKQVRGS